MAARGRGLFFPIYLYRKLEKIFLSETTGFQYNLAHLGWGGGGRAIKFYTKILEQGTWLKLQQ